jgi:hypothetical protein
MSSSSLSTTSLRKLTQQFPADGGWNDVVREGGDRLIKGDILKYRDWRWWVGSVVVPDGTRLATLAVIAYWQRWDNQKSVEIKVREPGGVLPDRHELSHADPSQWPIGPSGDRQDPWQDTRAVYMADPATAKAYTFITTSMGGHEAVRALSGQITRMRVARPGAVPIVELRSAEMKTRYGLKSKPVLEVVEWIGGETLPPEVERPLEAPRVVDAKAAAVRSRIHIDGSPSEVKAKSPAKPDPIDDELPW